MSPILLILNLFALLFAIILLSSLNSQFKKLFLLSAFIPLLSVGIILYLVFSDAQLGLKAIALFLLRGGFLFAVISGTIACYIVSTKRK